jgi:hypothetical protein
MLVLLPAHHGSIQRSWRRATHHDPSLDCCGKLRKSKIHFVNRKWL